VSIVERSLSAIKDVLLLREQMKDLREDVTGLSRNVTALANDVRDIDRRVARLEGSERALLALVPRQPPQLPDE
jgi:hypothetical protein